MRKILAIVLLLLASAGAANAQSWPQRPIKMIVPFAAGGSADFFARLIVPKMSASLGQPVVIENRPGAGGVLGDDLVAKAAPDGYTIALSGKGSLVLAPHMMKVPYAPFDDLTYVTLIASVPNVLTVHSTLGVASVADFIYVIGGEGTPSASVSPLQYLQQPDKWQELDSPVLKVGSHLGLVPVQTSLYAIGGKTGETATAQNLAYQAIYTILLPIR